MTEVRAPDWATEVTTEVDAEFTVYPERIRVRAVSNNVTACNFCAARRYMELNCGDLPKCYGITLVPIEDAEVVSKMTQWRLGLLETRVFFPVIHIAERKVVPCDSSSTSSDPSSSQPV
jgi:hypothetical protein